MQWGQFVDHDITHTPTVRGEDETGIQCCSDQGETLSKRDRHRACFPIDIPDNDRMFSKVTRMMNIDSTYYQIVKIPLNGFFTAVWSEVHGVCEVNASTKVTQEICNKSNGTLFQGRLQLRSKRAGATPPSYIWEKFPPKKTFLLLLPFNTQINQITAWIDGSNVYGRYIQDNL